MKNCLPRCIFFSSKPQLFHFALLQRMSTNHRTFVSLTLRPHKRHRCCKAEGTDYTQKFNLWTMSPTLLKSPPSVYVSWKFKVSTSRLNSDLRWAESFSVKLWTSSCTVKVQRPSEGKVSTAHLWAGFQHKSVFIRDVDTSSSNHVDRWVWPAEAECWLWTTR